MWWLILLVITLNRFFYIEFQSRGWNLIRDKNDNFLCIKGGLHCICRQKKYVMRYESELLRIIIKQFWRVMVNFISYYTEQFFLHPISKSGLKFDSWQKWPFFVHKRGTTMYMSSFPPVLLPTCPCLALQLITVLVRWSVDFPLLTISSPTSITDMLVGQQSSS